MWACHLGSPPPPSLPPPILSTPPQSKQSGPLQTRDTPAHRGSGCFRAGQRQQREGILHRIVRNGGGPGAPQTLQVTGKELQSSACAPGSG